MRRINGEIALFSLTVDVPLNQSEHNEIEKALVKRRKLSSGRLQAESSGLAVRDELEDLNEELETLNTEARGLETRIAENVAKLLEARR